MRLLNVTSLQLEEFFGLAIPSYAILSHCWGSDEVLFQDIIGSSWRERLGAKKIHFACQQSREDRLEYVWIDTCCIDKSSSAELSEAINSMYSWYEEATVCYAYLEDVVVSAQTLKVDVVPLHESRWFTRGWTLQELVAPSTVSFYGENWAYLGTRRELANNISAVTRIPTKVLQNPLELEHASIAKRMSWAAGRQTTRTEDVAYCLMGLFDVHMPLLYGEGSKAFTRLQEEILKISDDQSIFAWDVQKDAPWDTELYLDCGVLAGSPAAFANSGNCIPYPMKEKRQPYVMTNRGLQIELRLHFSNIALLDCQYENDFTGCIGIYLKEGSQPSVFSRHPGFGSGLIKVSIQEMKECNLHTIYILKNPKVAERLRRYETCLLDVFPTTICHYEVVETRPRRLEWNARSQTLQILPVAYEEPWAAFHFHDEVRRTSFVVMVLFAKQAWESWVKIRPLPQGGLSPQWLLPQVRTRGDDAKGPFQVFEYAEGEEEGGGKERPQDLNNGVRCKVLATIGKREMLNQDVWSLNIKFESDGV